MIREAFHRQYPHKSYTMRKAMLSERKEWRRLPYDARENGAGMSSHTVFVGREFVVKGPLSGNPTKPSDLEWRTLNALKCVEGNVQVPRVEYVWDNFFLFNQYKLKKGRPLSSVFMSEMMSPKECAHAAGDLMQTLHKQGQVLTESSLHAEYRNLAPEEDIEALKEKLDYYLGEGLLSPRTHDVAVDYLPVVKDTPRQVIHGDLTPDNVWVNPDTKRLASILDFGEAHMSYLEADVASCWYSFGEKFAENMCDEYSNIAQRKVTLRDCFVFYMAQEVAAGNDDVVESIGRRVHALSKPSLGGK